MSALKPLIYFSLFDHSLTEEEVIQYAETSDVRIIKDDIDVLLNKGIIEKRDGFLLYDNDESHIQRRLRGNSNAKAVMPRAFQRAKAVFRFPFVVGVGISGSLSKGYFDENSDFDFFVITKPRRVWIARTMMAFYKRLFLLNSHKEFCVNYYISTETLEIEEKNRFTATEIVTVIPIFGEAIFNQFYAENDWVRTYFPNMDLAKKLKNIQKNPTTRTKRSFETILDNFVGQMINYSFMRIITFRWKKRYKSKASSAYKSETDISKHHPESFQEKVIKSLNHKYQSCKEVHGINISEEHA